MKVFDEDEHLEPVHRVELRQVAEEQALLAARSAAVLNNVQLARKGGSGVRKYMSSSVIMTSRIRTTKFCTPRLRRQSKRTEPVTHENHSSWPNNDETLARAIVIASGTIIWEGPSQ